MIAFALLGAGLWAGYRWFRRESARVAEDLKRAEAELSKRQKRAADAMPTLKADPETGVYRPAGDTTGRR